MGIRLLPDSLSNKIAAGEVVERPASVVKELIENSLDAGATDIRIEIEKAGISRIRIIDNGSGIAPDELPLAIQRHATSKISTEDDLFAITSFGFRGEALPSIASVSRFRIVSKRKEDEIARFIEVEGGHILNQGMTGAPDGTEVDVRDLFFNVPARRKFLKKPATEFSHIMDVVSRIFMLRPDVRVVLTHNGIEILNLPRTEFDIERAAKILGQEAWSKLFPVEQEWEGLKIWGFVSAPEFVRRTSTSAFYFYVNGRPIRDKIIHQAVVNAYGTLIEKGTYPLVVLNLQIPPQDVDVNVHPAKSEVRFKDRNRIFSFVRSALVQVIDSVPWMRGDLDEPTNASEPAPKVPPSMEYDPTSKLNTPTRTGATNHNSIHPNVERPVGNVHEVSYPQPERDEFRVEPAELGSHAEAKRFKFQNPAIENLEHSLLPGGKFSNLAVIGILNNTYILAESHRGLVIVDQHAAHERVLFVKLKHSNKTKGVEKSTQLFPIVVDVGNALAAIAEANIDFLNDAGFEIETLSSGSVAIKTVPAMIEKKADPAKLLRSLLEELAEFGNSSAADEVVDLVIATTACHSAIRAGDPITLAEAEELLKLLDETERSGYCPHGRPVIIEIGLPELERRFGRRG